MDQFHYGLRNDVKDLLLTFHEDLRSLTEAVSRVDLRCDNRLFERRSERQLMSRQKTNQTYASIVASTPTSTTQTHMIPSSGPSPMEIDVTRCRGPLSEAEKQRRRANCLCLYCGGPGHIAITCPHRPKQQVSQVSTCEKFQSNSPTRSSRPNSPTCHGQSNSFEVLSQLDEILTNKSNQNRSHLVGQS